MKRASEGRFGQYLRQVQLTGLIWKPADDMRNWKPCDYIAWWKVVGGEAADTFWFEVKDTPAKDAFGRREIRPSQWESARRAEELGIPYFLAVWWRERQMWTLSDLYKVTAWFNTYPDATSIPRRLLMTRYGVDSSGANLAQTIKIAVLEGLT